MKKHATHELSKKDVAHIANLIKIPLDEKEMSKLAEQLSQTLHSIEKLQEITTTNLSPTNQVTGLENVFRTDEIIEEQRLTSKQALSNASKTHNDLFEVVGIFQNE